MQLHLATWPEVEEYLARSTGILIPIGSTEQHGPTGLIGTDCICPEVIARRVGDETGAMVAPTFNVGVAQHHMGFPGTITLRPQTMIAALTDWITSLARHGFTHFYFLNGHGGNIATIQAAFAEIYAGASLAPAGVNLPAVTCILRNWWMLPRVKDRRDRMFGSREGGHGTPAEISVTYFAHPDRAQSRRLDPEIAPSGPFTDAADYRRRFPDGRIGSDPSLATPEHGAELVATAAREVAEDYARFLAPATA